MIVFYWESGRVSPGLKPDDNEAHSREDDPDDVKCPLSPDSIRDWVQTQHAHHLTERLQRAPEGGVVRIQLPVALVVLKADIPDEPQVGNDIAEWSESNDHCYRLTHPFRFTWYPSQAAAIHIMVQAKTACIEVNTWLRYAGCPHGDSPS